jgi:dimethylglycine dehydrogenase
VAKAMEVYGHEYAMHFPWHRWPAAPNRRTSSLHDRLEAAGAQFGAYNGWERANWFAKPGDDTSETSTQTWERAGPWEPRIRAEAEAVRDHCGVLAISGFSRFEVEGPGARAFIDSLTSGKLPKEGRVGLGYFPDARGRIVTEMSVIVKGDDHVGLITAGTAQWHDSEHLWRQAPEGITVTDHSDEMECLLVTGPKAREILGPLTDADLSLPWLSVQTGCTLAGRPCSLLRVSFAGELGWEVHCPIGDAPAIWDAVTQAGATPFGMFALNSLRVEKGYRAWKGDLSTDYTLLEGGLDRFVDWSKPFVGKPALEAEKQRGVKKRFTLLTLDSPGAADAPYMSTIWQDGTLVGETTSGAWGYRTGQSVALAMLRPDLCAKGTKVEVEIFGERFLATVQGDAPLWDPQNDRLRA